MAAPEYDGIAEEYTRDQERRDDRRHILAPSARFYCGNLAGKRVLDLACGSGYFSRRLKEWGAAEVAGLDISAEMIRIAEEAESRNPLGVRYMTGDAAAAAGLGRFDLVFAGFLLHYAPSTEALFEMCGGIGAAMAEGGMFVAFNSNPDAPVPQGLYYDFRVEAAGGLIDGARLTRTHYAGGRRLFSFSYCHYSRETYDRALRRAGFGSVEWLPFVKGESAEREFRAGYWDDFTGMRHSDLVLRCRVPCGG